MKPPTKIPLNLKTFALIVILIASGGGDFLDVSTCGADRPASQLPEGVLAATAIPIVQGHYLLQVQVGHAEYTFMIDTGAPTSVLERSLAGAVDWESHIRRRQDEGFWLYNTTIGIGGNEFPLERILCRELSFLRTSSGDPIMGVLGMDFLKSRVLRLNGDKCELQICESPSTNGKWEHELDIEISDEPRPYIVAKVDGIPIRVLLDTGSAGAIQVDSGSFDKLARQKAIRPSYTPEIVASIDRSEVGRLYFPSTTVELGSLACEDQIATKLPEGKTYSILGGLFLCRFNFEIDFKEKKMRFSKSRLFAGRDCSDYGGIIMEHSWFGVVASGVVKGSIAERAGVRPGDRIIKVGSIDATTHGERRIVKALLEPRIDNFQMLVKRHGEIYTVNMVIGHRSGGEDKIGIPQR